jgi:TRAP-type transport system small permease protein
MIHRIAKRLLEPLLVGAISLIVLTTTSQVVSRYVVGSALIWTEELARYLGVWTVMLASGLVLHEGMHVGLDAILERTPVRFKQTVTLVSLVAILVFAVALVLVGWDLVMSVRRTSSAALRISMSWVYAAVPVGGALIAFFDIILILENLRRKDAQ